MDNECMDWLNEVKAVFPDLQRKIILSDYNKITHKSLGYVKAKIEQK